MNQKATVVRNMFNACLMAAFRFHAIVKHILMRTAPRHTRDKAVDPRFLAHRVIKECCFKMVGHVSCVRRNGIHCRISNSETAWLCYEAFRRKLKQHGKLYSNIVPVVTSLRKEQEREMTNLKLTKLRVWIGNRIPRPFRRMKHRK